MTKAQRLEAYNKYGGHCAYCGREISLKDMQVDHIVPQSAHPFYKQDIDIDGINNKNPSCRRCNHYKRANGLETFRRYLLDMKRKVLDDTYLGKVAMDYGMIDWKGWDGKFYFEKVGK